jgi:hypothetical protein
MILGFEIITVLFINVAKLGEDRDRAKGELWYKQRLGLGSSVFLPVVLWSTLPHVGI